MTEFLTADHRNVSVKHGSTKWVPRSITVDIVPTDEPGDHYTDVPSIAVMEVGRWMVTLTWNEARQLAEAITHVTDVAEYG